jgi:hypothetical protein
MNFGLLCDDPDAAELLAAIRRHPAHHLTRAVLVSPAADALLHGQPGMQILPDWENLLVERHVDAVIVGGQSPQVWDGARRLASEAIPLLVVPSLSNGAAVLYELSLIRDDRQGVIVPTWLSPYDLELRRLHYLVRSDERPAISYLQFERELGLGPGAEVPQLALDEELLHAAALLRFVFGPADHVTALRTGGTPTGALIQSVVLGGPAIPETTWVVKSAERDLTRLTLHTDACPRVFERPAGSPHWIAVGPSGPADEEPAGAADRLIAAFADICERAAHEVSGPPTESADWKDVIHAAEIVDAAQRSLARRRTIELHHETLSERAIFKTQMAAMGCTVLMITLVLMLGYLAVASAFPLETQVLNILRLVVFAPIFVFLLLQFLLPLTRG